MKVLAAIISYNPSREAFPTVLSAAADQADHALLVDNGSAERAWIRELAEAKGAHFIENRTNLGIAAAQNQAIAHAREVGARSVLLLDHDTVLSPGALSRLEAHLADLEGSGARPAVLGCSYLERNSGRMNRPVRTAGFRLRPANAGPLHHLVEVDFVIASGSLIPLSALSAVGDMEEGLFIDLVDLEWCLRAGSRGYRSFMAQDVVLDHRLGTGQAWVGRRSFALHEPLRHYYYVRNALRLAARSYVGAAWRLFLLSRVAGFLIVYPLFGDRRLLRLRSILAGIRDGLLGRSGPRSR